MGTQRKQDDSNMLKLSQHSTLPARSWTQAVQRDPSTTGNSMDLYVLNGQIMVSVRWQKPQRLVAYERISWSRGISGFPCWWILAGHPVTQATVRFWDVSEHQPVVAWQTEEAAAMSFLNDLRLLWVCLIIQRLLIVESIHWSEFHRANRAIYILWNTLISLSLSLSLSLYGGLNI